MIYLLYLSVFSLHRSCFLRISFLLINSYVLKIIYILYIYTPLKAHFVFWDVLFGDLISYFWATLQGEISKVYFIKFIFIYQVLSLSCFRILCPLYLIVIPVPHLIFKSLLIYSLSSLEHIISLLSYCKDFLFLGLDAVDSFPLFTHSYHSCLNLNDTFFWASPSTLDEPLPYDMLWYYSFPWLYIHNMNVYLYTHILGPCMILWPNALIKNNLRMKGLTWFLV